MHRTARTSRYIAITQNIDDTIQERSKKLIDCSVNEETPIEKSEFSDFTSSEVELVEQKDLIKFVTVDLANKDLSFRDLIIAVFSHFFDHRKRDINRSGINFDRMELEGPSPLLYFDE